MTFVVFEWDGIERPLEEADSKAVIAELRGKSAFRPQAAKLAERIEAEVYGSTASQPAQNVQLDPDEQRELRDALDRIDERSELNHARRALQTALYGERRPGEPGYRT
jgi:hypothetical protein